MSDKPELAAAVFTQFTQEDVDRIVKAMVLAGLEQAQYLARLAVEETRLGVVEDKVIKNMVASEFVYNYIKDKRTVGVIREIPGAQPAGNGRTNWCSVLADPDYESDFDGSVQVHRGDQDAKRSHLQSSSQGVALLRRGREDHVRNSGEARRAGRSVYLRGISTLPGQRLLMHHKDVGLIDATGGPGVVKAAYSSGKPALGVGAGNTPVYLEKSGGPEYGGRGHHHLEDLRQRNDLRLRADGGDR